ncbi:MAG: hypothetical protein V1862_07075 [Methanobacteriota archaeon]
MPPHLRRWLEERGVRVLGEAGFSKRESEDPWRWNELIRMIIDAYQDDDDLGN